MSGPAALILVDSALKSESLSEVFSVRRTVPPFAANFLANSAARPSPYGVESSTTAAVFAATFSPVAASAPVGPWTESMVQVRKMLLKP